MSVVIYDEGIHAGVPPEIYHAKEFGVVSKSALDHIARSPAHYRAWVEGTEDRETPAMLFGRVVHALVLEPNCFDQAFAVMPDFGDLRTKAAKADRDAWLAEHLAVTSILAEDMARARAIRDAVMAHPLAGRLFENGIPEATAIWTDRRHALLCKARYDYWRPDLCVIGDLKTTEDASPTAFARSVANFRYHVQDAHYSAGAEALGAGCPSFVFVAVEKSPPHAVCVYQLDGESRGRGADLRDRDMERFNECFRSDAWPSYPATVNTLSLPAWAFRD